MSAIDDVTSESHMEGELPEEYWQFRPERWWKALLAFGCSGTVGTLIVRIITMRSNPEMEFNREYYWYNNWEYNFLALMIISFGVWAAFTDREWPVWKRIVWIFTLLILQFLMKFIPFGIVTGILTMGIVSPSVISAMILVFWAMRRSTYFVESVVEPAQPER
jgi:hypothetical protein